MEPASKQRTLSNPIGATGVGRHSARKVFIRLLPAPVDTGIVFYRTDIETSVTVKAAPENLADGSFSTNLSKGRVKISAIQHLMAAFAGLGIDNAFVELSASEVPIMDGSAAPFVFLVEAAGIREQDALRRYIQVKRPVFVREGERWAGLYPGGTLRIEYSTGALHPRFPRAQRASVNVSPTVFVREISRARTFRFIDKRDRLYIKRMGAGNLCANGVLIDDNRILNTDGLRAPDEFVRHRILDVIGDLYLLGSPILGRFRGYKADHGLVHRLVRSLQCDESAWESAAQGQTAAATCPA